MPMVREQMTSMIMHGDKKASSHQPVVLTAPSILACPGGNDW